MDACRFAALLPLLFLTFANARPADPPKEPPVVARPEAFQTLVNPECSHCRDEARRRAGELRPDDRVLAWVRGYSDGGAIPIRFFLNPYRVVSDSYGVFVYDPDAGFARGFEPSYDFAFHGWRNGVMAMRHKDGTLVLVPDRAGVRRPEEGGAAQAGADPGDRLGGLARAVSGRRGVQDVRQVPAGRVAGHAER